MEFQDISVAKKEGITQLTINRPPVNVLRYETLLEINTCLAEMQREAETRVLLIRGSGSRAFCAGVEVRDHLGERLPQTLREFDKLFRLLRSLGKPSIAVVNGVALGGGCELVAGCDMAIAVDRAEFGQPEIKLAGLAPVAAVLFPRIMGQKKALELILMGENISAAEAERLGLVNKVVPAEELEKTVAEFVQKLLAKSSLGLKLVRDIFYQCADIAELGQAMQYGTEMGIKTWETEDAQEGLKSFLEKRPPVWKNK